MKKLTITFVLVLISSISFAGGVSQWQDASEGNESGGSFGIVITIFLVILAIYLSKKEKK